MCMALLVGRRLRFLMYGEYVFVGFRGGSLLPTEVYDLFFELDDAWEEGRLLCISPHNLIDNGTLRVTPKRTPGIDERFDLVYRGAGVVGSSWSEDGVFTVKIAGRTNKYEPIVETYTGQVIVPRARIPSEVADDPAALTFMQETGTLFALELGKLSPGRYAMRLVVEPVALHGSPPRTPRTPTDPDEPVTAWQQEAVIVCPKNCYHDYRKVVEWTIRDMPEIREAAAAIRTLIDPQKNMVVPTDRHRIMVVLPPGSQLERISTDGCAWFAGTRAVGDGSGAEWVSGANTYWMDDVESTVRRIWRYLRDWSAGKPKTKEQVTSAVVGVTHENSSSLVDALAKYKLVHHVDPKAEGLYQAAHVTVKPKFPF